MSKKENSGSYTPLVEIKDVEDFRSPNEPSLFGDRRDGKLYRYTPEIKLAVNVALATGRPLLVMGATGCGKSSLAFNLARLMKRRYYEFVVTSRSQARDLFYRFDAVRRLADSQLASLKRASTKEPSNDAEEQMRRGNDPEATLLRQCPYVEPGPLWWMLDRSGAERRGYPKDIELPFRSAVDPVIWKPDLSVEAGSLLLIDEIDKAEPDFPNNLLVPLGSWQFTVEEIAKLILLVSGEKADDPRSYPFVVITSNQQRELPATFLRRCIVLEILPPSPSHLVEIATTEFGARKDDFYERIAKRLEELRGQEDLSIAEFLDAVKAIQKLKASNSILIEILEQSAWRPIEP